jgi:hypothetical protein
MSLSRAASVLRPRVKPFGGRAVRRREAEEAYCARCPAPLPVSSAGLGINRRRRGRLVELPLDVAQGLGDFFGLRLEVFGKHVEASSDDTGDHP